MAVAEKVEKALTRSLKAEYVQLNDEDGISGFVVSRDFVGMAPLDRQALIDGVLDKTSPPLSRDERRHILMIAGLTPEEYDAASPTIRVHRIQKIATGELQIMLRGSMKDAELVRAVLLDACDISASKPEQSPGAPFLMTFRAKKKGIAAPLTREDAIRALKKSPHIELLVNGAKHE